ncbi:MAG: aminoacyl-tRNA hydrolase [Gammaproteobacteria bacterium]
MTEDASIQLAVGLGNPGERYQRTRHNAGFWFMEELARGFQQTFREERKFLGESARISCGEFDTRLLKPLTFMNRSGQAVQLAAGYYHIPMSRVLIIHDEIDLPPGTARIKRGGGHGGHNGLRDVFDHVGKDFWRLRIGVGHPGHKDDVIDYVLEPPRREEQELILESIDDALAATPRLLAGEFERAMHQLHSNSEGRASDGGESEPDGGDQL